MDMDAQLNAVYRYFELKEMKNWLSADTTYPPMLLISDLRSNLNGCFQSDYFTTESPICYRLPYSHSSQFPMDETVAIYATMFYSAVWSAISQIT